MTPIPHGDAWVSLGSKELQQKRASFDCWEAALTFAGTDAEVAGFDSKLRARYHCESMIQPS